MELFHCDFRRLPAVIIDRLAMDIAIYARNPDHVIELLRLTAWWIEYTRVRMLCQPKTVEKNPKTTWRCPDCEEQVPANKDRCSDPHCVSWNKLFQCTGESRFRPIVIRGGKNVTKA